MNPCQIKALEYGLGDILTFRLGMRSLSERELYALVMNRFEPWYWNGHWND